jgi:hypothetical protein
MHVPVSYPQPNAARAAIAEALEAGFRHFILGLPTPYPAGVAQWVADNIITPSIGRRG